MRLIKVAVACVNQTPFAWDENFVHLRMAIEHARAEGATRTTRVVARVLDELELVDDGIRRSADVLGGVQLRSGVLDLPIAEWAREEGIADAEIRERLTQTVDRKAAEKVANYGPELMRSVEKSLLLQLLDQLWKEHLLTLDHLRQGIGLRAYAQRDPLNEYKREAFNLFETMSQGLREAVTAQLMRVEIVQQPQEGVPELPPMQASHLDPNTGEVVVTQEEAPGGGEARVE